MKTIILAMLVSSIAFAGGPGPEDERNQCYQKVITVCPLKKPKPKKKVVVVPPAPAERPVPEVIVTAPAPVDVQVINPPVKVTIHELPPPAPVVVQDVPKKVDPPPAPKVEEEKKLVGGFHAALGVGVVNPKSDLGHLSGMAGLRLHHKPSHLGGELYVAFNEGVGLDAMVWTYQGKRLSHHIDLGVLYKGNVFDATSVSDVPRSLDLSIGTGLEIPVSKRVDITVDWKMRVPDPVFVATHSSPVRDADGNQVYGPAGRYLDVPHVLGNSFLQSQVFLGILIHE